MFIRLWTCACGLPWLTCPQHKDEPSRLRPLSNPTQRAVAKPRAKPTRVMGRGRDESIQRWLDAPMPKRRRPNPMEVELEERPSLPQAPQLHMLGPTLQRRFQHLGRLHPPGGGSAGWGVADSPSQQMLPKGGQGHATVHGHTSLPSVGRTTQTATSSTMSSAPTTNQPPHPPV